MYITCAHEQLKERNAFNFKNVLFWCFPGENYENYNV